MFIPPLQSYALIKKNSSVTLYLGEVRYLDSFSELKKLSQSHPSLVFLTPFSVVAEKGYDCRGRDPLKVMIIEEKRSFSVDDFVNELPVVSVNVEGDFVPEVGDDEFGEMVGRIQAEEIEGGNASQVVLSRVFSSKIENFSEEVVLSLYRRLLRVKGNYMTYLFADKRGVEPRFYCGGSPERHLEVTEDSYVMMPLAGTMPKGEKEDFEMRLGEFIRDEKEINELFQVVDEELKIMARICEPGMKVSGPFLREVGEVVHTEYKIEGKKKALSPLEVFENTFHAPTLVGSPMESACRIIAEYEKSSRHYYGGEIGVLEGDLLDTAIMIRSGEIDSEGNVRVQAGCGIVRDSQPTKEVEETRAKASSFFAHFGETVKNEEMFLTEAIYSAIADEFESRSQRLSRFHCGDSESVTLKDKHVGIINNEDDFAYVIEHVLSAKGMKVEVMDTFVAKERLNEFDVVVVGPGPGDINDGANPRMVELRGVVKQLLNENIKTVGVCLGHQAICRERGLEVVIQDECTQGVARKVEVLGREEVLGFYNSFSPVGEIPEGMKGDRDEEGRVIALVGGCHASVQFHPESVLSQNGDRVLMELIESVCGGQDYESSFRKGNFSVNDVEAFLTDETLSDEKRAELLKVVNEHLDGEVMAHFVSVLRKHQAHQFSFPGAIDVCGTGGSGLPRLNTSTISSFVLGALGVKMVKHGNKAASGRFGSFDLLETLRVKIEQSPEEMNYLFFKTGVACLYARQYHPVVGRFTKARALVGVPTIFNYVGPLLNPASPEFQLIGTPNLRVHELVAGAAVALKMNVVVVTGLDGLDEVSVSGGTKITEVNSGIAKSFEISPDDFGITAYKKTDCLVSDVDDKIRLAEEIFKGKSDGPHAALVIANCACALKHLGRVDSYKEGVKMVKAVIENGEVYRLFDQYRTLSQNQNILTEIVGNKYEEIREMNDDQSDLQVSRKDFKKALCKESLSVIAEIKRASPSRGMIAEGEFDPVGRAQRYGENGARAISVLCDERYFKGGFPVLKEVAEATSLPVLCKEFVIDERQIYEARRNGADAILLIASVLDASQIEECIQCAKALGMDALVEVHSEDELKMVLESTSAEIVGINNRDLKAFTVDVGATRRVIESVSAERVRDVVFVSESGIKSGVEIAQLPSVVSAVLVGEGVVNDPEKIGELVEAFPLTKICGVSGQETLNVCAERGVSFVGFNFVPSSSRYVTPDVVSEFSVPGRVKTVGIFQDQSLEEVREIADRLSLDFVQLSGDESLDYVKQIDHCGVMKGIRVVDEKSLDKAREFAQWCAYIVLESAAPGKGMRFDPALLDHLDFPVLMAGGLSAEVIPSLPRHRSIRGFDVASGVETDGKKDHLKISSFIKSCHYKH